MSTASTSPERTARASASRLAWALALFGLVGFVIWLRLHQPPNTVDDAYITFRYARNIAQGVGFVYNPGERVLGTTTPAYALLLAALSRVSGFYDYPRLALVVNAVLDAITLSLVARLVGRLTEFRWAGLGAALLLALDGRTLDFSTGGMETSFNLLAIVLALVLFFEGRSRWAAAAAGLAVLIRPDGLTLAAAMFAGWGLDAVRQRARWPWVEAAIFAAVVGPWIIFATLFFGQPIPQSILAKSVVYRLPALTAFRALLVQLRTVFPFSLPPLQDPEPLPRQLLQALLPAALVALGLIALQRRHGRAWVIGAYIGLFILFFAVGNPLWLGWYEVPMMPLYQALILGAVLWLASRARPGLPRQATVWALGLLAVGVMAVPHLSRLNLIPWETARNPSWVLNPTFNKKREEDYEMLARMLLPAAQWDRVVAIPEIGAFGYVYSGTVFDTTGLISPPVLRYFPIAPEIPIEIYSVPRQAIFDLQPDLFVTFDSFIQATLPPDDPEFLRLYRPTIALTSHAAFGIQRLIAYRRGDLPLEAALPPEAQRVEVRFGADLMRLEGFRVRPWADREQAYFELTLFWRGSPSAIAEDLLVRVNLMAAGEGADKELVYQVLDRPGDGLFPTPTWAPGMILVDRYQLKRPAPDRSAYAAAVTVFSAEADDPLPARTPEGTILPEGTYRLPIPAPGDDVPQLETRP